MQVVALLCNVDSDSPRPWQVCLLDCGMPGKQAAHGAGKEGAAKLIAAAAAKKEKE